MHKIEIDLKRKEVGTPSPQDCWLGDLLMSSMGDVGCALITLMTTKSCCIPEVMSGCANWGLMVDLGCDRMRSNGSSRVQLDSIRETKQVREVLRGAVR